MGNMPGQRQRPMNNKDRAPGGCDMVIAVPVLVLGAAFMLIRGLRRRG